MGDPTEKDEENSRMGLTVSKPELGDRFYGVHIPNRSEDDFLHVYEDKSEALKVVKHHKKARFKAFTERADAVAFAMHGSDNAEENSTTSINRQSDGEKPSPFKGPKPQDMVQLRRAIEAGNIESVSKTVWENPRFLISSGDTPSILQEGSRYNALHIAAKSKNAFMTEFILQTIINPDFTKLLYGVTSQSGGKFGSASERSAVLLDLYLNTPDKGMHETPLHFASKFGALQVVSILVSYSECDRVPINKFGQRPIDIVCVRCPNATEELKSEISSLLQNEFYVPVLRAEDDSLQPVVGTPFSPKDPPVLNKDPLSPRLEIHAFAGPMSESEATEFHRLWRTPQRGKKTILDNESKSCPSTLRLRDPQKGLERVGRDLAADRCVPWKEYWPFLNTFTDLSHPEGLALLEEFLSKRYQSIVDTHSKSTLNDLSKSPVFPEESVEGLEVNKDLDGTDTEPEVLSPVTQLCSMMDACTIMDDSIGSGLGCGSPALSSSPSTSPSKDSGGLLSSSARFFDWLSRKPAVIQKNSSENIQNEAILTALSSPTLSPFLYVEKSLQLFAKRIAASLHHLISSSSTHNLKDSVWDVLKPEVKRIQNLVSSYMEDARFVAVDYHLVHSRIASSVAERLVALLTSEEREVFYNSLQGILAAKGRCFLDGSLSSDEDETVSSSTSYRQPRTCRQTISNQKLAIRCIVGQMVWALDQLQGSGPEGRSPLPPRPQVRTENECLEMWSDAYLCLCSWPAHSQANFSRGSRKSSSFKRLMSSPVNVEGLGQTVSRRLDYDNKHEIEGCGFKDPQEREIKSHLLEEEEEGDTFITPPSSPRRKPLSSDESDSDEEMFMPDEGPSVFLEGYTPSKLDADVFEAIKGCNISESSYPCIYRWKHEVLLHPPEERKLWRVRRLGGSSDSPLRSSVPSTPNLTSTPSCSVKIDVSSTPSWSRITGVYSPSPTKICKQT